MIYHRPSNSRGTADFGWLQSHHSFSFGSYYDPSHMGISTLRVINDDTVAAGAGFGTHGHHNMEIISYIIKGAIEHQDSMGNKFVVPAGDVQRMSAGTGIQHSEFNHSKTDELKFLQIWITPNKQNIEPSYQQKTIEQTKTLTPLVTPNGIDNSLTLQQDASLFRLALVANETIELSTETRPGYLHVIEGKGEVDQDQLSQSMENPNLEPGDGLGAIEESLRITAGREGLTALWFDLPNG